LCFSVTARAALYSRPLHDALPIFLFKAVRYLIGEGNDQFVDDMYSTQDGKLLIVSRPSFADVVAIETETGKIAWRFQEEGYRSRSEEHTSELQSRENLVCRRRFQK